VAVGVNLLFFIPLSGVIGLIVIVVLAYTIFHSDVGNDRMQEVAGFIREGANAFLSRQYRTIGILALVVAVILYFVTKEWQTPVAFALGAVCSALSGFIGMYVAVRSNLRTAAAARTTMNKALQISFRGGAVTGLAVTCLSMLGVAGLFYGFGGSADPQHVPLLIVGFGFGASFVALFAQLGGGIYTKAADVGADLVGKIEAGIPEDDPRNPAVVADLVGDNVGDCAGRGADLFESTAAENIGAMILGIALYKYFGVAGILFPLVARATGIIASIIGIFFVSCKEEEDPMNGLNRGYVVTMVLVAIALFFVTRIMLTAPGVNFLYFFGCAITGIITSFLFVLITQYYTSINYRPVKEIGNACETGPATAIIQGTAVGMESTALPVLAIAAAIIVSYFLGSHSGLPTVSGGLYGTAVATMGMLASCAYILAMDTFGPITDNAGGIAEMSELPADVRKRTDRLDACGNTTKALTKGYAVGSAALAAFLLFSAYIDKVKSLLNWPVDKVFPIDIGKPAVFVGAFIAVMVVFLFTSVTIRAVGNAAQVVIKEVRRQFKEIPGIMAGTAQPSYSECVDIVTKGALKEMILPGLLVVLAPVIVGVTLKAEAAAAFLMVGTIAGVVMALYLNNAGGAWDNAKKTIELGAHGGKGSESFMASVVGDTVGDPFKDTAGPSIHVLIKLFSTITLVLASLFL
jgi:K(+)-stimulated pyrophosphate-energized sodium pump